MAYRLEIGLALLLAGAIALALWAANRHPRSTEFDFRPSTFVSGPDGSQALHEVLLRLGRLSERRRLPLDNLTIERAHRPAILVVVNPFLPLKDNELEQVVGYVRRGWSVVSVGDGGGITGCAGWRIQPEGIRADSIGVRAPSPGLALPPTAHVLTLRRPGEAGASSPLQGLVKGAEQNGGGSPGICGALVPQAIDTVVAALNRRPAILRLYYRGGGTITLVADPGWFTNRVWRDTDMPVVVVPLLTPSPQRPGRVAWDEYHQGFGENSESSLMGRTWSWLRESPAGWAILQLIAVSLVWLALTAVRFGPPRSAIERRRRSPLEHLEALGAGLESAAAADTAVQRLAAGLQRRLGWSRAASHGTNGNVGPWVESLELAVRDANGRAAVRRLHELLTAARQLERTGSAPATRVLQVAQAVEDVWEHLRPRSMRNA